MSNGRLAGYTFTRRLIPLADYRAWPSVNSRTDLRINAAIVLLSSPTGWFYCKTPIKLFSGHQKTLIVHSLFYTIIKWNYRNSYYYNFLRVLHGYRFSIIPIQTYDKFLLFDNIHCYDIFNKYYHFYNYFFTLFYLSIFMVHTWTIICNDSDSDWHDDTILALRNLIDLEYIVILKTNFIKKRLMKAITSNY